MTYKNNEFIVLANSSTAKIYHYNIKTHKLDLLKEMVHEKASWKTSEIMSDEAGRYQKSVPPNQGSYAAPTDPQEIEAKKFAAELAEALPKKIDQANATVIIAPGQFQSLLKQKLNKQFLENLTAFYDKDYTKLPIKDLEKHLSDLLDLKF